MFQVQCGSGVSQGPYKTIVFTIMDSEKSGGNECDITAGPDSVADQCSPANNAACESSAPQVAEPDSVIQVQAPGPPAKKRVTARMQLEGLGFLLASLNKKDTIDETENVDGESNIEDSSAENCTTSSENANKSETSAQQKQMNVPQKLFEYTHPDRCIVRMKNAFSWEYSKKDKRKDTWNNFVKGCKWSPDGTSLLTNSDDRICRVFTFPNSMYDCYKSDATFDEKAGKALSFGENEVKLLCSDRYGELIYDFVWNPLMVSSDPDSCLYACTGRDHPIHLINICEKKLVAVYGAINHLELLQSCHSVSFSNDAHNLIAGLNKNIRVFNIHRPGMECDTRKIRTTVYGSMGLNGIVSCIKMSPQHNSVFAAASYAKSIGLFDLNCDEPQCIFQTEGGGVTNLLFSKDGIKLIAGARKDPALTCYDIRNPGTILYTLDRTVHTNQRIYFDTDFCDNYLVSGSSCGRVSVWDMCKYDDDCRPTLIDKWQAHDTCVAGISVNPNLPILATSSGQRIFPTPLLSNDSEDSDGDSDRYDKVENCVKLWWIGENIRNH